MNIKIIYEYTLRDEFGIWLNDPPDNPKELQKEAIYQANKTNDLRLNLIRSYLKPAPLIWSGETLKLIKNTKEIIYDREV